MIRKVMFSLCLVLFLAVESANAAQSLQLKAAQAVLYDMDTGLIIWEKKMNKQAHPASLTKIATVLTGLRFGDHKKVVIVSQKAGNLNTGSIIGLKSEDEIKFEDLLKAAMIVSANDATIAIAEATAGDLELFLQLMNGTAYGFGLVSTSFTNTHGLSVANHRISPYDLAVWSAMAMRNPEFKALAGMKEAEIMIKRKGEEKKLTLRNTNRLLFSDQGIYGIKTGTTSLAGKCLAGAWDAHGHHFIGIVLNSSERWGDMLKLKRFTEERCTKEIIVDFDQDWQRVRLGGNRPLEFDVISKKRIEVVLPASEKNQIIKRVYINPNIKLPVKAQQPVGKAEFWFGNQFIGRIELYPDRDIITKFWHRKQ